MSRGNLLTTHQKFQFIMMDKLYRFVQLFTSRLRSVESDSLDLLAEEEKARKTIAEINKKKLKNLQQYCENTQV